MKRLVTAFNLFLTLSSFAKSSDGTCSLLYNVAPYSPGNEEKLANDMITYCKRTGNDTVLYSLSFHAEGRPALVKTERLLASYRKLRQSFSGSPIKLGMLLQSTLGHWPIVGDEHEPWQRTKTIDGEGIRFCPLDPGHRAFIRETVRRAAQEKPVLMMTDDDITGFKHTAECFCPFHLAEFERRTGRAFSCDELRAIVRKGKDRALVDAFDQLQEDTVIGFAKLIREAIDSVDPSIPCCACMPGGEPWRAGRTAKTLAAKGQAPMLRICNGQYSEFRGDDFASRVLCTQILYNLWKMEIPNLLDESDTFPHNLWSKSSRSFHAKLAASYFCGLKGGKLWYVNAHRGGLAVSRNYTDVLADHAGYYAAIGSAVEGAEPIGVLIPACDDPLKRPGWDNCESGWVKESFGIYGIPFRAEGDYAKAGVWALAGADLVTQRLSADELKKILSHPVLIDGAAAEALTRLGFSELIGVHAEKSDLSFHYEKLEHLAIKLLPSDNAPVLKPLEGAKSLTTLIHKDAGSGAERTIAPGTTIFRNALGGSVIVTAWSAGVEYYNRRSEHRQRWIGMLLDELTDGAFAVRSADEQDTLALAARAKDGALLVELVNLCYDPLERVSFKSAMSVKNAELLDHDGQWRSLDIIHDPSGNIALPVRIEMMEERIFRFVR